MSISIQNNLPFKFKIGSALIVDPAPHSPLLKKVEMLARNYPQMRFTTVYESDLRLDLEDGFAVYDVKLPPAKVNG